jgi:hypothetical protein
LPSRGRPRSLKLHELDTLATVKHIRMRGLELYHWKGTKIVDVLAKEGKFVRMMVERVKSKKFQNISNSMLGTIRQLIHKLELYEKVHHNPQQSQN